MPTKKSHIVPQFYLRGFSADKRQLWVFDKETLKIYKNSIKDIGAEAGFYRSEFLEEKIGDKEITEKLFHPEEAYISTNLQSFIDRISSGDYHDIEPGEAGILARAITSQHKRGKAFRTTILQQGEGFYRRLLEEQFSAEIMSGMDIIPNHPTEEHLLQILDPKLDEQFFNALIEYNHIIYRSGCEDLFYSSDTPVVLTKGAPLAKDNMILYPLTPTLCVALYAGMWFPNLRPQHRKILMASPEIIKHFNRLQVMNSIRHVICETNNFHLATSICDEFPKYRDRDRVRIETKRIGPNIVSKAVPLI